MKIHTPVGGIGGASGEAAAEARVSTAARVDRTRNVKYIMVKKLERSSVSSLRYLYV